MATETPAIKQIASGLRFPEGPMAMPDGSVILVEIERQTLSRVTPDGKVHVIAALGGGPNGAAMGPGGKIYVTNNGGFNWMVRPGKTFPITQADDYKGGSIQIVDPETGKFETLYDACDGRRLRGPNDLVFDGAGGFWFTDLGKTRERDSDRGAVYYARADGSRIEEAIFPLERPNGIGLSPDDGTLYVVETPTARCWSFRLSGPGRIESANGPYRGEKGKVVVGLGGYQMFDSLAVDDEGHICVATLITGAVSDIWPDGSRVDQYVLPDMMVTNVCFGGPELRTAFATLSMGGTLVSFEWPRPGLGASPSEPVERTSRMALADRYGLPVSTSSAVAVERYQDGMDNLLAYGVDGERSFAEAVAADEGLALAHAGGALLAFMKGDGAAAKTRHRPRGGPRGQARPGASGSTSRRCRHSWPGRPRAASPSSTST